MHFRDLSTAEDAFGHVPSLPAMNSASGLAELPRCLLAPPSWRVPEATARRVPAPPHTLSLHPKDGQRLRVRL